MTFFLEWLSRRGGGVSEMARQLALELASRPELTVTAVGLDDEFIHEDRRLWGRVDVRVCRMRGPRALGYSPEVQAAVAASRPDIVHLHNSWYLALASAARAARKSSIPYVLTAHGSLDAWALGLARLKKAAAKHTYYRRVLNGASRIHVHTEAEAKSVRDFGATAPLALIPNGFRLPALPAKAEFADASKLLYVGRLHPKKNLPSLIKAWRDVKRRPEAEGWTLNIVGWSQIGHEAELRKLVADLGVSETVSISPPAYGSEKDELLRSASAFILPSFSEGQPLAALEAMAYGLPVLMTPECNLLEPFSIGAAFPIGTAPEAIAEGLARFFGLSPAARTSAGFAARAYVENSLTWEKIGDQIITMYREAISQSRK